METPFGDTLQATVPVGLFDPPWETFGARISIAAPGAGNARARIFYQVGQQISAIRIRGISSTQVGFAGASVRTVNMQENADPIFAPLTIFSSLGSAWPFNVRVSSILGTGARGWTVGTPEQILPTEGLFVRAPNVVEIVLTAATTAMDLNVLVDVMRSQGPVG